MYAFWTPWTLQHLGKLFWTSNLQLLKSLILIEATYITHELLDCKSRPITIQKCKQLLAMTSSILFLRQTCHSSCNPSNYPSNSYYCHFYFTAASFLGPVAHKLLEALLLWYVTTKQGKYFYLFSSSSPSSGVQSCCIPTYPRIPLHFTQNSDARVLTRSDPFSTMICSAPHVLEMKFSKHIALHFIDFMTFCLHFLIIRRILCEILGKIICLSLFLSKTYTYWP